MGPNAFWIRAIGLAIFLLPLGIHSQVRKDDIDWSWLLARAERYAKEGHSFLYAEVAPSWVNPALLARAKDRKLFADHGLRVEQALYCQLALAGLFSEPYKQGNSQAMFSASVDLLAAIFQDVRAVGPSKLFLVGSDLDKSGLEHQLFNDYVRAALSSTSFHMPKQFREVHAKSIAAIASSWPDATKRQHVLAYAGSMLVIAEMDEGVALLEQRADLNELDPSDRLRALVELTKTYQKRRTAKEVGFAASRALQTAKAMKDEERAGEWYSLLDLSKVALESSLFQLAEDLVTLLPLNSIPDRNRIDFYLQRAAAQWQQSRPTEARSTMMVAASFLKKGKPVLSVEDDRIDAFGDRFHLDPKRVDLEFQIDLARSLVGASAKFAIPVRVAAVLTLAQLLLAKDEDSEASREFARASSLASKASAQWGREILLKEVELLASKGRRSEALKACRSLSNSLLGSKDPLALRVQYVEVQLLKDLLDHEGLVSKGRTLSEIARSDGHFWLYIDVAMRVAQSLHSLKRCRDGDRLAKAMVAYADSRTDDLEKAACLRAVQQSRGGHPLWKDVAQKQYELVRKLLRRDPVADTDRWLGQGSDPGWDRALFNSYGGGVGVSTRLPNPGHLWEVTVWTGFSAQAWLAGEERWLDAVELQRELDGFTRKANRQTNGPDFWDVLWEARLLRRGGMIAVSEDKARLALELAQKEPDTAGTQPKKMLEAHLTLAEVLSDLGRFDQADEALSQAEVFGSSIETWRLFDGELHRRRAALQFRQGNFRDALESLQRGKGLPTFGLATSPELKEDVLFSLEHRAQLTSLEKERSMILASSRTRKLKAEERHRLVDIERARASIRYEAESKAEIKALAKLPIASFEHVLSALPPAVVLIEFECRGDTPFAIVVSKGQVTGRTLSIARRDVHNLTSTVTRELKSRRNPAMELRKLYAGVLKPFEDLIQGQRHLILCTDGPTAEIPFAALIDERGRYLIEHFDLSYSVSASSWLAGRRNLRSITKDSSALVLANPELKSNAEVAASRDYGDLRSLPHAEREAEEIARLLPASRVLLRGAATEEAVATGRSGYEILHFACHGVIATTSGQESALVLAQPAKGSKWDGFLEVSEVARLSLRTRLAVLSACSTATGDSASKGMGGLAWAFTVAGCPGVVATLWDISDQASSTWITSLYKELIRGQSPAESARAATLALLKTKGQSIDFSSPHYWAPWVMWGS